MSNITYKLLPLSVSGTPAFTEATREELRVLLALVECGGRIDSVEELAALSHTTKARCSSALTLWEEEGVIRASSDLPTVTEEFEERISEGGIDEEPSEQVARTVRDEGLRGMLDEVASIMQKAALSTTDIKNISGIYSQYALSAEFIVTLAAYLAGKGKLTSVRLKNEAIRLADRGCDTLEELEKYIEDRESERGIDHEFRRVLGIYNRNLSQSEREYFKKWSDELGYSVSVVAEAYDVAVINTGKGSLPYMDKLLTAWHEAGCRTVAECKSKAAADRAEGRIKTTEKKRERSRTEPEKPRYGSFDINEAFQNALLRSYGDDEK